MVTVSDYFWIKMFLNCLNSAPTDKRFTTVSMLWRLSTFASALQLNKRDIFEGNSKRLSSRWPYIAQFTGAAFSDQIWHNAENCRAPVFGAPENGYKVVTKIQKDSSSLSDKTPRAHPQALTALNTQWSTQFQILIRFQIHLNVVDFMWKLWAYLNQISQVPVRDYYHPNMTVSILFVLGVLTPLLFILVTKLKYRHSLPLPPGPRGWPILGSFFEMPESFEWLHWAKFKGLYGEYVIRHSIIIH